MSYIGNTPTSIAFLTDLFTGTGSLSVFTMSAAPASTSSILVSITGVLQEPSTYSVSGNTLTFSQAPPAGTGNISVRYLGIPASNIVSTAYRTVTDFTATLAQTIFTVPSYTVGYITVYRNGARLGAADYTATNGTTVVLTVAANTGDLVTTESFYVSSVLNAIPAVAGAVTSSYIVPNVTLSSPSYTGTLTGSTGVLNIGSGQLYKDASGNVGFSTTPASWDSGGNITLKSGGTLFSVSGALNIGTNAYYNVGWKYSTTGYATNYNQLNGVHSWQYAASGTAGATVTFLEAMRIDSAGNVGIGTSSPSKILHVYTATGNGIYVEDGSSAMPSPTIRVRGWRSDTNGSQTFGGGLVLERKGDSATANGTVLGTIYFGGNYNTTPNFGYAASISGIADGAFTSSTNTPTALTFYTGVTPNLDTNTANVFTGTERMRIDSSGNVKLSTAGTVIQNSSGRSILNQTGSILQVVNATYATQTTANSSTWVDTGLSASITPSSTSSKILVIVQQAGCGKDTGDTTLQLQLLRGSTALFKFEASGGYTATATRNFIGTCGTTYLDSPATTSAVTYKTQQSTFSSVVGGYTQFNIGNGVPTSTITLLEISG